MLNLNAVRYRELTYLDVLEPVEGDGLDGDLPAWTTSCPSAVFNMLKPGQSQACDAR